MLTSLPERERRSAVITADRSNKKRKNFFTPFPGIEFRCCVWNRNLLTKARKAAPYIICKMHGLYVLLFVQINQGLRNLFTADLTRFSITISARRNRNFIRNISVALFGAYVKTQTILNLYTVPLLFLRQNANADPVHEVAVSNITFLCINIKDKPVMENSSWSSRTLFHSETLIFLCRDVKLKQSSLECKRNERKL